MKPPGKYFFAVVLTLLVLPNWRATAGPWTNLTTSSVSANSYYSLAVRSDGTVWVWGTNQLGELGASPATLRVSPFPRPIDGFTNAIAVAAATGPLLRLRNF